MKKAIYHFDGNQKDVVVLKEHANGTVDLGPDEEHVIVTECPVSDAPKSGHVVVEGGLAKGKDDPTKHKKP